MATKPSTIPTFATDSTVVNAGSVENGLATRVEPTYRAQGFRSLTEAIARHMNWMLGTIGDWLTYLSDLHGSTEFLNKSYNWVAKHTISISAAGTALSVTNAQASADAIKASAASGGAALNAAAGDVLVVTGDVVVSAGDVDAVAGNVAAGGEFNYYSPPSHTNYFLPKGTHSSSASGWVESASLLLTTQGGTSLVCSLPLPFGATLTDVKVKLACGDDASGNMSVSLYKITYVDDGTTVNTIGAPLASASSSGTGVQRLTLNPGAGQVKTSQFEFRVAISASLAAATDQIFYVRYTFTDPGPRNY